jgi:hypothetical protein
MEEKLYQMVANGAKMRMRTKGNEPAAKLAGELMGKQL